MDDKQSLSAEQQAVADWLGKVKFRRSLFGVSEKDVWKKLAQLDELYRQALLAERIRYDVLLEERLNAAKEGEGLT